MVDLVTDGKALFNPNAEISKQYKEGYVGPPPASTSWKTPCGRRTPAAGQRLGYVCNTSTGITSGTATSPSHGRLRRFNVGDVFTIGVNKVHPETKVSTGVLQQFVVTAANAGGATTVIAFADRHLGAPPSRT
jgi:hypothetical protein